MDDKTVVTSATATLEGLNILEFITADRVVARLTSEGKHGQKETHIIALGSEFDNLRIGGHPVKVTLHHDLFLKNPSHADLTKAVATLKNSGRIVATDDGAILCSLVEKIETTLPGVEIKGHILRIPHFGEVSLAEVFAVPGTRTLTMIRLKLGSPSGGTAAGPEVLSQGQPMAACSLITSGTSHVSFIFLVFFSCLLTSGCQRVRDPSHLRAHICEIVHGDLQSAGTESDQAIQLYSLRSPEWGWRFKILKAQVLVTQSRGQEALACSCGVIFPRPSLLRTSPSEADVCGLGYRILQDLTNQKRSLLQTKSPPRFFQPALLAKWLKHGVRLDSPQAICRREPRLSSGPRAGANNTIFPR